jgi:hypothetical protein
MRFLKKRSDFLLRYGQTLTLINVAERFALNGQTLKRSRYLDTARLALLTVYSGKTENSRPNTRYATLRAKRSRA